MKKMIYPALVVAILSTSAYAADSNCYVLGVHEPGTNIYDGPTFCARTVLSDITVRGPLQLDGTTISGLTTVSGPIKASSANLQSLLLKENLTSQEVYLLANSVVQGDITFEGKEGTVHLQAGSSIKGKVINGQVVEEKGK